MAMKTSKINWFIHITQNLILYDAETQICFKRRSLHLLHLNLAEFQLLYNYSG